MREGQDVESEELWSISKLACLDSKFHKDTEQQGRAWELEVRTDVNILRKSTEKKPNVLLHSSHVWNVWKFIYKDVTLA